mmetsp:Transcript_32405/g.71157  ORF Transcript_32405/g.71157 Transcript_32405/m.71157 type:complete len:274 (+) Transcript_32405:158-979(+)
MKYLVFAILSASAGVPVDAFPAIATFGRHRSKVVDLSRSGVICSADAGEQQEQVISLPKSSLTTRSSFLSTLSSASATIGIGASFAPSPSFARGRATLEAAYDRYTPRIVTGGEFYAKELKKMIEKNDWEAIKAATSDPPKKTKADRSKLDGGVAERAAQAGQFCDARVLTAADLYAAAFSDNSISPKTKAMKAEVMKMRDAVTGINSAAREALGEGKSGGGGLFGLGGKKASQTDLAKVIRKLYVDGGNAYNAYIYAANEELPLQLKKLPYL